VNSRFLKTPAIVMNSTQFGEGHKLVRLYTEMQGKTEASAFGARKTKSRFGSRLEPFTVGDVLLYHKSEDSPFSIREMEVTDSNAAIRDDLGKFMVGSACIETVIRYVEREHRDPDLFRALSHTLQVLSGVPQEKSLYVLSMYDVKFLSIMGYRPYAELCVKCSKPIEVSETYSDSNSGYPVCARCRSASAIPVEPSVRRFFEWAATAPMHRAVKVTMKEKTLQQVRKVLEHLYLSIFQKKPESWSQLRSPFV
jgi:DNA repair protein RecO (recombination protein O)